MSVNKVILVGRLGKDPEVRATNSGTKVATCRLATDERAKVNGEWGEHTEWHSVVFFGRTAEVVEQYCGKGKQLYVEGRIRTREWTDKDGNKRWSTEVIGDQMKMLGGGEQRSGQASQHGGTGNYTSENPYDADIPF